MLRAGALVALGLVWLLFTAACSDGGRDTSKVDATSSASETGTGSRDDLDGDGFRDEAELIFGSDPRDSRSRPEFVGIETTCEDSEDNDLDELADMKDSGCIDPDGDTIPDLVDNCPTVNDQNLLDFDVDGHGDVCDEDDDDDAVDDGDDCSETTPNEAVDGNGCSDSQVDYDGDLVCDPQADSDGPLRCSGSDNCEAHSNGDQLDTDRDLLGDVCDSCPSTAESFLLDSDEDGIGDECDPDADGDGVDDAVDNCTISVSQADSDADGISDECDNCPSVANPDQANQPFEVDSDYHGDACDNCPHLTNDDQEDTDRDGVGERCDNCRSLGNPGQDDGDDDGVGDPCDNCPTVENPFQGDSDGDGIGSACEPAARSFDSRVASMGKSLGATRQLGDTT